MPLPYPGETIFRTLFILADLKPRLCEVPLTTRMLTKKDILWVAISFHYFFFKSLISLLTEHIWNRAFHTCILNVSYCKFLR